MSDLLEVSLNDTPVGKLILTSGEKILFAFEESYLNDRSRPTLSQSFLNESGDVITDVRPTHTRLPPFFSNLLPEGHLRDYLAKKGGIHPDREFKLIELLGEDLPGAVKIKSLDGNATIKNKKTSAKKSDTYRFSLAGIQLKFSALMERAGGLTISADGVGGNWIIKLPAQNFPHVPENEWSMLHLAAQIGIPVPEFKLIDLKNVLGLPDLGLLAGNKALAIKRFDRDDNSNKLIHIEDFAQVYNLFPINKYNKVSYNNMANVIWKLTNEEGLIDFIKRLVFTVMIGNGDMHLKNWSLIYPDTRTPILSPAYDFVSTIPYIPHDKLGLTLGDTKDIRSVSLTDYRKLAKKARVPEHVVLATVKETTALIHEAWDKNKKHYPIPDEMLKRIDEQIKNETR